MERSISGGDSGEPASVDDEAIRAAITEQVIRKEPTLAAGVYSQQAWEEQFERRWILPDMRYMRTSTEIEGGGGHIFCRSCVQPKKHGKLAAFKLHVTATEDPMKVAKWGILTLECHNCGFEQIVPRKPKAKSTDDVYIEDEYGKLADMMKRAPAFPGPAVGIGKSLIGMDPRAVAMGMSGNALANIGQQQARENMLSQLEVYQEFLQRHMEEAHRRVNAAVNPPLTGLRDKNFPV